MIHQQVILGENEQDRQRTLSKQSDELDDIKISDREHKS